LKLVRCEIPELQHLVDKEFHPGYLLLELQKCGINLMPKDKDAKLAGIEQKNAAAEERAIADVSNAVRAFHFRKAKWNQGVPGEEGIGPDQIVLRLRENLEFDEEFLEDYEPDWRYMAWWPNKCAFQAGCKDTDEQCKAELPEGHVTHCLLSQAIVGHSSDIAQCTTIDYTKVEFVDTMKKTLRLLKLFSFS
jgi:cancer susceptibility candidate protein 1